MDVIKITPRGYCYGVVDAIQIVKKVAADPTAPRPIYILGQIVHNQHVVDDLNKLGVIHWMALTALPFWIKWTQAP